MCGEVPGRECGGKSQVLIVIGTKGAESKLKTAEQTVNNTYLY